jgi:thiol-disulfide isomerase/thioredoxin
MASGTAAEHALLQVAEQIERAIDDEMSRIDNMDDDDLIELRKRRMNQLKETDKRRNEWLQKGHGVYDEVQDLQHFFNIVKTSERVVIHFMRRATSRCAILERHLSQLAKEHFETKFAYVDVERLPALAERFNIVMLPNIMLVEKQNTFHSIIGFDEFGGSDEFTTETARSVLAHYGMLNEKGMFAADQKDD